MEGAGSYLAREVLGAWDWMWEWEQSRVQGKRGQAGTQSCHGVPRRGRGGVGGRLRWGRCAPHRGSTAALGRCRAAGLVIAGRDGGGWRVAEVESPSSRPPSRVKAEQNRGDDGPPFYTAGR